jgi:hypothetical protein
LPQQGRSNQQKLLEEQQRLSVLAAEINSVGDADLIRSAVAILHAWKDAYRSANTNAYLRLHAASMRRAQKNEQ